MMKNFTLAVRDGLKFSSRAYFVIRKFAIAFFSKSVPIEMLPQVGPISIEVVHIHKDIDKHIVDMGTQYKTILADNELTQMSCQLSQAICHMIG